MAWLGQAEKLINRIFLNRFLGQNEERLFQAKVLLVLHVFILTVVPLSIVVGANEPMLNLMMVGILLLSALSLIFLAFGHVTVVTVASFTGMGVLATAIPFTLIHYDPHDIYILSTSHMFIIVVASLISQKRGYTHFTTLMGLLYILFEFFARAVPNSTHPFHDLNNYIICLLLVGLTGFILSSTLKRRQKLLEIDANKSRELEKNLKEKEILLNEIHHRVKNNLNVAISLLRMQMNLHKNAPEVTLALQDSINRLYSMALVHERLYAGKNFNAVEFKPYIMSILSSVLRTYHDQGIAFQVDVGDDMSVELDRAIPCALILNELVTNVFKHAYPKGSSGNARVEFKAVDDRYVLAVSDQGVGMVNPGHSPSNSLGMKVVSLLTEQLAGTLEIDRSSGTRVQISFPQASN